ncbi:hypothetical protein MSMAL_0812 [Methanosarcina mazei LYC]|uniref:Uncharacterized protein n=1 Tax=Methanosarcina mazei LYC TaxID=1434114 RepID=A0A0E3RP30_METMZ|nr:hypothetical protein MSMAL_0812 [Methanosarcina mazei LYC]
MPFPEVSPKNERLPPPLENILEKNLQTDLYSSPGSYEPAGSFKGITPKIRIYSGLKICSKIRISLL